MALQCLRLFLACCGWLALGLLVPGKTARAGPPADFAGTLFIAADGCVLERDGRQWRPRLLPDGARDCGYPPTPVAGSEGRPPSNDLPLAPGLPEAEARLLATMVEGLAPGDLLPAGEGAAPKPSASHPVAAELATALTPAGTTARAIAAGQRPNARLCALLGQDSGAPMGQAAGADPSRGFCPGDGPDPLTAALRPAAHLPALARPDHGPATALSGEMMPASDDRSADGGGSDTGMAVTALAVAPPATDARPVAAPRSGVFSPTAQAVARDTAPRRPVVAKPATGSPADLIPADARYLQVATYPDAAAAAADFARLHALGLPVARGRRGGDAGVLVLAGPFETRRAIVRAHDRLRGAGFVRIVPR